MDLNPHRKTSRVWGSVTIRHVQPCWELTPIKDNLMARCGLVLDYMGTSLIRERTPLGLYMRTIPRVLEGS